MPSFAYVDCRWLFTVRGERKSRVAISLELRPCAASDAISRSRGVSGSAPCENLSSGVRAPSQAAARVAARCRSAVASRPRPSERAACPADANASAA